MSSVCGGNQVRSTKTSVSYLQSRTGVVPCRHGGVEEDFSGNLRSSGELHAKEG